MIKNERQYRTTRAKAERFREALRTPGAPSPAVHPLLAQAQEDAMRGQLVTLDEELAEYDALRSGRRRELCLQSLDELPRALIQGRIAAGLTQKELAEQIGLKEQQVQQYEASDYAGASLTRIREVAAALDLGVRADVSLPPPRER